MSTIEENTKDSVDAAVKEPGAPEKESEKIEPGLAQGSIIVSFVIGLAIALIIGWIVFPALLYSEKEQPFDFSHEVHNDLVDGCESCHYFRDDGTFAGVPKLWLCRDCHEEVQGGTADEETFVYEYVWNDREVPWRIYSKQPDCVFFSHAAHVVKAEMDCETCHGPIGESDSLKPYEENVITGYSRDIWGKSISGLNKKHIWESMKMDDCADCHKEAGMESSVQTKKDACFVCHK